MADETKNRRLEAEYERYFRVEHRPPRDVESSLEQPSPDKVVWGLTTYGVEERPVATWRGMTADAKLEPGS